MKAWILCRNSSRLFVPVRPPSPPSTWPPSAERIFGARKVPPTSATKIAAAVAIMTDVSRPWFEEPPWEAWGSLIGSPGKGRRESYHEGTKARRRHEDGIYLSMGPFL